jgi:small conductance mechanosensitive channel
MFEINHLIELGIEWIPFSISVTLGILFLFFSSKFFNYLNSKSIENHKIYYQVVMFFFGIIFLITLILNSPLSDTTKGQLLSLLGILLTAAVALSSSTLLGNMMAGLMLKGLSKYRPGDYLHVENHFGRVTELGLLHTEIQTPDRDLLTLPNMYIVNQPVKVIRDSGTILSEELSLGYEVHHNKIEEALIHAAQRTNLSDPFMHIQKIGDFSVVYRISGFLQDVKNIISTKAKFRENILDCLHEKNIEIVSPSFMNQRVFKTDASFIPKYQRESKEVTEKNMEDIVFDKAEEAHSKENIKLHIEDLEKQIKELESQKPDSEDESYQKKIESLKKRKEKYTKILKEIS